LKVLYISHSHPNADAPMENMGGMQRVSHQLVTALRSHPGVDIHTRILDSPWNSIVWNTARFMTGLFTQLPVIAQTLKPDVILFSSMVTASLAVPLRQRLHVPLVTINHGQDVTLPNPIYQAFVPSVFRALDGVISVSQATREACVKRGMDPEKGVALPNGFIPNTSDIPIDRRTATEMLQPLVPFDLTGKKVLLSVGRMVKRKGHAWFVDAVMPRLDPNIVYVILGDGPERESVQRAVDTHGLGGRVVLLGRQPDTILDVAYAAADLFVMPNIPVHGDMEGFGIVLLEANARGLPAIGADLEGIRDVIQNGENGRKVPVVDTEAWIDGIGALLSENADSQRERARQFVHDRFDWAHIADLYIQYLQDVIDRYSFRSV